MSRVSNSVCTAEVVASTPPQSIFYYEETTVLNQACSRMLLDKTNQKCPCQIGKEFDEM